METLIHDPIRPPSRRRFAHEKLERRDEIQRRHFPEIPAGLDGRSGGSHEAPERMIAAPVIVRPELNQLSLWVPHSVHQVRGALPLNTQIGEDRGGTATKCRGCPYHSLNSRLAAAYINQLHEIGFYLIQQAFVLGTRVDNALRLAPPKIHTEKTCIERRDGERPRFRPVCLRVEAVAF